MDVTLISDFLLVREIPEVADASGIFSPYGRRQDEPVQAEVLAAGPGFRRDSGLDPMPCAVGDTVLLQFRAGTEVRLGGELLRIIPARDIFGVVQG